MWFLIPPFIRRIPKKIPRHIVGWSIAVAAAAALPGFGLMLLFATFGSFEVGDTIKFEAANGTSILVTQDGFDGDTVVIYTQHDELHYNFARDAPEISGGPRVKDQDCRLENAGGELQLHCGDKTAMVVPTDTGA